MTTKQNANDLAKTARSEAAAIANGTKRTIMQIITNWNECVKQAGFMCIYDFPTTGYSRKSQIADDLIRCAGQLDDYCEPNPHAPQTVEQQTRELNAALTRVLDADEAHSEALEMNITEEQAMAYLSQQEFNFMSAEDKAMAISRALDEAIKMNAQLMQDAWDNSDEIGRSIEIEDAHVEALEMNRRCSELYFRYWRWWNVMDEDCRADDLACAHKQALKMNSLFKECA